MKNMKKVIGWLSPTLLLACFIPFVILCFYCFPSVDDFSYANIADSYGWIGAQIHWYTTWTGRYSATAILSFVPALIKNFTLYQLFSVAVLLGSVHSIYFVVRSLNVNANRWHAFLIALAAALAYLLFLPDITEAFYWFPGSVTYQLASILATYLLGLGIRAEIATVVKVRVWIAMSVLAFFVVGSNEVVMVVTAISVTLFYVFSLYHARGIFNGRLMVLIATALGCAFMVFSPGNNLRAESDLSERSFGQLSEAFAHSFSDMTVFVGQYFWIPVLPLLILGMLYFARPERLKVKWIQLFIAVALLFALFLSVIFPGYYIYNMAAPLRTQNFNLWILVLGTIVVARILAPLVLSIKPLKLLTHEMHVNFGIIGFLACVFLFSGYNGTQKAYADLFSGSAAEFENQYKMRTELLLSCNDEICTVPAYTAYPFTTFHSELELNPDNWWNYLYGKYNGNKRVSIDYNDLIPFYSQTLDFNLSDTFIKNYSVENITDSVTYKGGYSYHMSPAVEYGGGFSFSLDTIEMRYGNQPAYLKISSDAFFTDSIRNLHVVSVINGRSGNLLNWRSVSWLDSKDLGNGWENTELLIPLYMLDLHEDSEFKIFLWNPEGRDAFVDNISFSLY